VAQGFSNLGNGDTYKGEWNQFNQFHGKGKLNAAGGSSYEGYFKNHLKHGLGVFTWPDGGKYEG
jgi:1-phosphatidylinositol-4-phosphate 5-kinase